MRKNLDLKFHYWHLLETLHHFNLNFIVFPWTTLSNFSLVSLKRKFEIL